MSGPETLYPLSPYAASLITEPILAWLSTHTEVTADDVHDNICTRVRRDPRIVGIAFRVLAKRGIIKPTGKYVKSGRHENHGRPIVVWREVHD